MRIFVVCSNVLSEHIRIRKALRASLPDAKGPGRSFAEVALANQRGRLLEEFWVVVTRMESIIWSLFEGKVIDYRFRFLLSMSSP